MDDNAGFIISCMFITFVATWTLSNGSIYPESFEYAKRVCEQHKGLRFLDEDKTKFSTAVCNNGIKIDYDNSSLGERNETTY